MIACNVRIDTPNGTTLHLGDVPLVELGARIANAVNEYNSRPLATERKLGDPQDWEWTEENV